MKIIELAQKQRNNEILPKHIRYEDEDLYFDGVSYYDEQGNNDIFDVLAMNYNALTHLYDEIEIIEEVEDKEYEDIEEITIRDKTIGFPNGEWTARNMDKAFSHKINALIRNQKYILERLDK